MGVKISAALALVLCCCVRSVSAEFVATSTPTAPVRESDRVSADQLFARNVDISSYGQHPLSQLHINLPGRVFISYLANTSSDDGVFAKIKISGSSKAVVDLVNINFGSVYETYDYLNLYLKNSTKTSDALLVEIQLLRENALEYFSKAGSCDVVVLENVLYSRDKDLFLHDKKYSTTDIMLDIVSAGDVFVVDKTGLLSMDSLDLSAYYSCNVQVELAALNVSDRLYVSTSYTGNVSLFVNTLTASRFDVSLDEWNATGSVCVSADNNVNVSLSDNAREAQVSYPGKTQGATFPCEKREIPARVPVGDGSGSKSSGTPATKGKSSAAPSAISRSSLDPALVAISSIMASLLLAGI